MKRIDILLAALFVPAAALAQGQRTLTLDDCRRMAVENSRQLDMEKAAAEMAEYDKKTAVAYFFPKVSAVGGYMYNNRDVALVNEEQSERIRNMGTTLDDKIWASAEMNATEHGKAILETVRNTGIMPDIATPVNAIGQEIDAALHPDLHNIMGGSIVVEQPVFAGGKIVNSAIMASKAQELAESKLETSRSEIITDVDHAYWQIISISNKKKLAQSYSELLHKMEDDVMRSVDAGTGTMSDALQVKVKVNEADLLLTKATSGLALSKMLLCQKIGLPLDTEIILADEMLDEVPDPGMVSTRSMEDVFESRPELRSLDLAAQIYDRKVKIAAADILPTIAVFGACTATNPNIYDGFQNNFRGCTLSAGVVVKVPICHGGEGIWKVKKAKAEARQYHDRLEDTRELVTLQVARQRVIVEEAREKLQMTRSAVDVAEENLRSANLGYEAGVVTTSTVLGAHTAWLSANSDWIDAGTELQTAMSELRKAEGYKTEIY